MMVELFGVDGSDQRYVVGAAAESASESHLQGHELAAARDKRALGARQRIGGGGLSLGSGRFYSC